MIQRKTVIPVENHAGFLIAGHSYSLNGTSRLYAGDVPSGVPVSVPAIKWASIPKPGEPFRKVTIPVGDRVHRTQMADRHQRYEGSFEAYSDVQWLRSRLPWVEITLPDETEAGSAGKQPARGLFASNNDRPVSDAPMAYLAPAGSSRQEMRFFGRIDWTSEYVSKIHTRPGDALAFPS